MGHKTYKRSMSLLLVKAIYDVVHHEKIKKVRIHYSVSKGYYCTIDGDMELTQEFLDHVESRMPVSYTHLEKEITLSIMFWQQRRKEENFR